jgi:zinc transporter ZupT
LATCFTWFVTALGAATVFFFKSVNQKVLDGLLGFAAGVMIFVIVEELIPESQLGKTIGQYQLIEVVSWLSKCSTASLPRTEHAKKPSRLLAGLFC